MARQSDLLLTTETLWIKPVLFTHFPNLPANKLTPIILKMSQKIRHTRSTFIMEGMAPMRAFTTTCVKTNKRFSNVPPNHLHPWFISRSYYPSAGHKAIFLNKFFPSQFSSIIIYLSQRGNKHCHNSYHPSVLKTQYGWCGQTSSSQSN